MSFIPPFKRPSDCDPTPAELAQVQRDRLQRIRDELKNHDVDAVVLFDPTHMRYATGSRNMQVYSARNPARYVFIPQEGPVVLFEYAGCNFLADGLDTVDEIRPATAISYYFCGDKLNAVTKRWAAEIGDLMKRTGGKRIGLESATPAAAYELAALGYEVIDAQEPVERARAIKVPNEIKLIRSSSRAAEDAVRLLESHIRPGITENELWSHLHQHIIATDGDYVETRLLASGTRTNPWFAECSTKVIEKGEIVAMDTDVVGRYGYYADFSRTWVCGDVKPTDAQKKLYRLAYEQVEHNMGILKLGMSFREYTEKAWKIPDPYIKRRYFALAHGVGMNGEYPYIVHREDIVEKGYDGIIEPGMTLCIESYIGDEAGGEGVKLEQQVYMTETGIELITDYPFDPRLLG